MPASARIQRHRHRAHESRSPNVDRAAISLEQQRDVQTGKRRRRRCLPSGRRSAFICAETRGNRQIVERQIEIIENPSRRGGAGLSISRLCSVSPLIRVPALRSHVQIVAD